MPTQEGSGNGHRYHGEASRGLSSSRRTNRSEGPGPPGRSLPQVHRPVSVLRAELRPCRRAGRRLPARRSARVTGARAGRQDAVAARPAGKPAVGHVDEPGGTPLRGPGVLRARLDGNAAGQRAGGDLHRPGPAEAGGHGREAACFRPQGDGGGGIPALRQGADSSPALGRGRAGRTLLVPDLRTGAGGPDRRGRRCRGSTSARRRAPAPSSSDPQPEERHRDARRPSRCAPAITR